MSSVVRLEHDLGGNLRALSGCEKLASCRRVLPRSDHGVYTRADITLALRTSSTGFELAHKLTLASVDTEKLWSLRLQALLRLHLIDHLTTELSSLFALLPPSSYLSLNPPPSTVETPLFHPAVPFELHVLLASLHGLRGDLDRSVESLAAVLRGVKEELWASRRRGDAEGETMWRGRAERVGGLLAGVLADLKVSLLSFSSFLSDES